MPAGVYLSGLASRLAHVRLTLDACGSSGAPALIAEACRLAVTTPPGWQATAARTGAGIGTKVFAGAPTLSVTVAADRLEDTLGFLCATAAGLTRADLAEATASAERAGQSRRERLSPRTTARWLAAGPEPAPDQPVDPAGRLPWHVTLLADRAGAGLADTGLGGTGLGGTGLGGTGLGGTGRDGTAESAPDRGMRTAAQDLECPGTVSRSGTGEQTWYAACWELPPADAELAAAIELFLFALAGAPSSPLYQALRDDLGISYGPRTSVQLRRNGARAWLELAFPTAREAQARATTERILAGTDVRHWMDRNRNVLLSSVLAALDFGSGQADALALGRVIGSPSYSWDVAAHLAGGDVRRLLDRVPVALRTLSTARVGSYHA
jgi:hypothetical protein